MMRCIIHIIILSLFFLVSCSNTKSKKECLEYYTKHKQDYMVSKIVSGFEVKMEYLPKHLFQQDTAQHLKNQDLNFVLTIAPVKDYNDEYKATMFEKITKFEEYKDRVYNLNFEMDKLVEMSLDGGSIAYAPVLFNTENTYGLTKEIKINIVFAPQKSVQEFTVAKELDLVFTDEIFETGISHFVFDNHKINNISPSLCSID